MKQRGRCWFYATMTAIAATLAGCLVMTKDEGIRSVIYSVIGAVLGGTGMWGFENRNVSYSPTPTPTVISSEGDQLRRLDTHEKYIDEALRRVEDVERKQAVHEVAKDAHK